MKRKKIAIFYNQTFSGNLQYLYRYLVSKHPEWDAFWLVDSPKNVKDFPKDIPLLIRGQQITTEVLINTSVVFEDKFHMSYPAGLRESVPIVNLWHGVGLKEVELNNPICGKLSDRIMSRYIRNNVAYKRQVFFVTTSNQMVDHFIESTNVALDRFLLFGMPRLDQGIVTKEKISSKATILWAPTFRDSGDFEDILPLNRIPDLLTTLENKDIFLLFSPHPNMRKDQKFVDFEHQVKTSSNIKVLSTKDDVYDYLIDIKYSIVDYSSIFYDLVFLGFDKFIRYIPDFQNFIKMQNLFDQYYFTDTYGLVVKSIDDLLEALKQSKLSDMVDVKKKDILLKKYFDRQSNCASENILKKIPELQPSSQPLQSGLYSYNAKDVSDVRVLQRQAEKHRVIILHFDPFEKIFDCSGVDEYFIKSDESIDNFYKRIFYVELRKYNYDFWQHEGSQQIADERIPRKFGIRTRQYLEDFNRTKKISLLQAFWPKRIGSFKDDRIFENALAHSNKITRLIIDWKLTLISILYAKRKL